MTLAFQTKWNERMGVLAGQPNFFVEKIWNSLISELDISFEIQDEYYRKHKEKLAKGWDCQWNDSRLIPKCTTIREDNSDRWKAGMKIHFVINNRTKKRFQFAPVVLCVSVQEIEIKHIPFGKNGNRFSQIYVDGNAINQEGEKIIALNDGFPSVEAFFQYFNKDFSGKIIHWTDLKY